MTNYDRLKQSRDCLVKLKRSGYIKVEVFRDLKIYEDFKKLEGSRRDRYRQLALKYELSSYRIQRIINNLETYL